MIIYAIISCVHLTGTSNLGPYDYVYCEAPDATDLFETLRACQQYASRFASKDKSGRYWLSAQQWFECRSKHVDVWEREP